MSLKYTAAARIEHTTGTPQHVTVDLVEKLAATSDISEVETCLVDLIGYFTKRHKDYTHDLTTAAEYAVRAAIDEVTDDYTTH